MGTYPPPPPPPGPPYGPPYGNDWKYQQRRMKEQARIQRDIYRAQRQAYRYQARSLRRSSVVGPVLIITIGIIFLLIHFRYRILLFDVYIDFHQVGTYLIFASLVMSLWSAGEYFRFFVRAAEEQAKRSAHEHDPSPGQGQGE